MWRKKTQDSFLDCPLHTSTSQSSHTSYSRRGGRGRHSNRKEDNDEPTSPIVSKKSAEPESRSGGLIGEGLFNPHSLELFSGWERWDWVDLGVFAGMVVFVAGVSVQLLESCGWDCLAYFVLVVSGIDEVVWLWRSKKSGSAGRRGGIPRSLLLRRHQRRKGGASGKNGAASVSGGGGTRGNDNGVGGWGYGEGLGLHMWLWLAGAVVLCTWRASVALHLLFLFAFCVYHWTMKEKLPHLNF
mmetsp:Transcript_22877/g.40499  ORF Transcript_22877/g.40499 Transcript_22877/m.40499 type:complete len:242 (-) Transcript_22877:701-1426(-)